MAVSDSNALIPRLAPCNCVDSFAGTPGRMPRSASSCLIYFESVTGSVPRWSGVCLCGVTGVRARLCG